MPTPKISAEQMNIGAQFKEKLRLFCAEGMIYIKCIHVKAPLGVRKTFYNFIHPLKSLGDIRVTRRLQKHINYVVCRNKSQTSPAFVRHHPTAPSSDPQDSQSPSRVRFSVRDELGHYIIFHSPDVHIVDCNELITWQQLFDEGAPLLFIYTRTRVKKRQ